MIMYVILAILVVLITAIGQVLLKSGSSRGKNDARFFAPYANLTTITAYGLFFFITVLSVIILQGIPLKLFYAIASLNLVMIIILSHFFLKEKITKNHILATTLIVVGIVLFNVM